MYSISGTLKVKSDERQVSDTFKVREFVLTDNSSQYPQHLQFQLVQDKCTLLDNINVGSEITVNFNLRGREWTSKEGVVKYFNTLDAWKIEAQGSAAATPEAPVSENFIKEEEEGDLPF